METNEAKFNPTTLQVAQALQKEEGCKDKSLREICTSEEFRMCLVRKITEQIVEGVFK